MPNLPAWITPFPSLSSFFCLSPGTFTLPEALDLSSQVAIFIQIKWWLSPWIRLLVIAGDLPCTWYTPMQMVGKPKVSVVPSLVPRLEGWPFRHVY